jgi:hypothetical protein
VFLVGFFLQFLDNIVELNWKFSTADWTGSAFSLKSIRFPKFYKCSELHSSLL